MLILFLFFFWNRYFCCGVDFIWIRCSLSFLRLLLAGFSINIIGMAGILISVRFGFFFSQSPSHTSIESLEGRFVVWFTPAINSFNEYNVSLETFETNSFGSSFGSFGTIVWNDGIFYVVFFSLHLYLQLENRFILCLKYFICLNDMFWRSKQLKHFELIEN